MEIADRQKVGLTLRKPLACCRALALGAMPIATAIIGDAGVATVLARFDMTAERSRAAGLDGRHYLELVEADMPGVCRSPGCPVSAEDIGDLQCGAHRGSVWALAFDQQLEMFERARHRTDRLRRDAGIERGRIEL